MTVSGCRVCCDDSKFDRKLYVFDMLHVLAIRVFAFRSGSCQVRLSFLFSLQVPAMRFNIGLGFLLLAVPVTVSACEGDCIVAITNAWIGNYSEPVTTIMDNLVSSFPYALRRPAYLTCAFATGLANRERYAQ